MAKFSLKSESQLATCHPELRLLFNEVIQYIDCTVLEGFRCQADQEKAFNAGKSKLHFPNGNHNKSPSMAVDVAPYPIDWSNDNRFFWLAGFVMGIAERLYKEGKMTYRVRYGGDWNRNYNIDDEHGLRDLVHFELITL